MSSPVTTVAGLTAGATAAAMSSGPLFEVFNELGLVLAIMGGLGGMARGLAMGLGWRKFLRGVCLGAILAFGIGSLSQYFIADLLHIKLADGGNFTVMGLASSAFIISFLQDRIVSRLLDRGEDA